MTWVLGIDAGATKAVGCLRNLASGEVFQQRTGSASLTHDRQATILRLTDLIEHLHQQGAVSAVDVSLAIGIAGACNPDAVKELQQALEPMGFKQLQITSDAITSAYGAAQGKPVLAVAVGTGSVALRLDTQGQIKQFGGWGFVAGDQGSGADMGRNLVKASLIRFDAEDYHADALLMAVFARIGTTKAEILNWLSQAGPADFAALAPIMLEYPDNLLTRAVIQQAGESINKLIRRAQTEPALPVCLLGGLADHLGPWLDPAIQTHLIPAMGTSLDGALWLAEQALD